MLLIWQKVIPIITSNLVSISCVPKMKAETEEISVEKRVDEYLP